MIEKARRRLIAGRTTLFFIRRPLTVEPLTMDKGVPPPLKADAFSSIVALQKIFGIELKG
ncbi:MAG: hypothetical protein IJ668_02030 [Selenomonadaceae bacterium]|nr:hypothetical protein [Selenomonadaceae bacterium]